MRFSVSCNLDYQIRTPDGASFVFNIEAQRRASQMILEERLELSQGTAPERAEMSDTGNRIVRLFAEPGSLKVAYSAIVDLTPAKLSPEAVREVPMPRLPLDLLTYTYPSRYIESDLLQRFARKEFGEIRPGHGRVAAICNWVCEHLDYQLGSSDEHTSARDTLLQRSGVCRDFAHLAIGFCRALGIPARFVSAYAWKLSPPDFHAVMEAWLEGPDGGAWFLFDPTRKAAADGLVCIGTGRDAADVAFCSPHGEVECGKPEVRIAALDRAKEEASTVRAVTATDV